MNGYYRWLACAVGVLVLGACEPTDASEKTATVLRGAPAHGDRQAGAVIAGKWCAGCHGGGATLRDNAPTFAALAASQRTDGAIRAFLMEPHSPMPLLSLSRQEIEDILAYLHSLKATVPAAP